MSIVSGVAPSGSTVGIREMKAEQVEGQKEVAEQKSEGVAQERFQAADKDEYIPGEAPTSAGVYQLSKGEDGTPKVAFKDPSAEEEQTCTVNTNKVDAEIEKLKERKGNLEQQIAQAADDHDKKERLEKELQQVDREISRKDNDSYRRSHAQYTFDS